MNVIRTVIVKQRHTASRRQGRGRHGAVTAVMLTLALGLAPLAGRTFAGVTRTIPVGALSDPNSAVRTDPNAVAQVIPGTPNSLRPSIEYDVPGYLTWMCE